MLEDIILYQGKFQILYGTPKIMQKGLVNVTGTSGTAILRLGHVQKLCQKF